MQLVKEEKKRNANMRRLYKRYYGKLRVCNVYPGLGSGVPFLYQPGAL